MGTTAKEVDGANTPLRVLVVDDDQAVAGTATAFLEHVDEGLSVESETEPSRALERLESERFDCVVSAYFFPDSDGLTFCERVTENAPTVARLLFTTAAAEGVEARARDRGLGFLAKGGIADQYEELAERIRARVRARGSPRV